MEKKTYAKLSELDGKSFTVTKAFGYSFKKWDEASHRMLMETQWRAGLREEGYKKMYGIDTNIGILDISEAQMKNMLETVYKEGVADINGKTFKVKRVVGKNDIPTYYFNVDWNANSKTDTVAEVIDDEPIEIPDNLGW